MTSIQATGQLSGQQPSAAAPAVVFSHGSTHTPAQKKLTFKSQAVLPASFVNAPPAKPIATTRKWSLVSAISNVCHKFVEVIKAIALYIFGRKRAPEFVPNPYPDGQFIQQVPLSELLSEMKKEAEHQKEATLIFSMDEGKLTSIAQVRRRLNPILQGVKALDDLLKMAPAHNISQSQKSDMLALREYFLQVFDVLKCKAMRHSEHLLKLYHKTKSEMEKFQDPSDAPVEEYMSYIKDQDCLRALGFLLDPAEQKEVSEKSLLQKLSDFVFGVDSGHIAKETIDRLPASQTSSAEIDLPFIPWSSNSCYMDVVLWYLMAHKDEFCRNLDTALFKQTGESERDYEARKTILHALNAFIMASKSKDANEIHRAREHVRVAVFTVGGGEFYQGSEGEQKDSQAFLNLVLKSINHTVNMAEIKSGLNKDAAHQTIKQQPCHTIGLYLTSFLLKDRKEAGILNPAKAVNFKDLFDYEFAPRENTPDNIWRHDDHDVCHYTTQYQLQLESNHKPPSYLFFQINRYGEKQEDKTKFSFKLDNPIQVGDGNGHFKMDFRRAFGPTKESLSLDYELVAVVNHAGLSLNHGHYTIDLKDDKTGSWVHADDMDTVSKQANFAVNGKEAYIFVFKHAPSHYQKHEYDSDETLSVASHSSTISSLNSSGASSPRSPIPSPKSSSPRTITPEPTPLQI